MAVTLQELVDKAVVQAKVGLDPQLVPTRLEVVANSLLGQVFEEVARDFSGEGKTLPKVTKTLTFTNGVAALSTDTLTGFWDDAILFDPANPNNEYVYVPYWEDFIRVYDTRIGYFTIVGTSVYVIEPGSTYQNGSGLTGDLSLVVTAVPSVPTAAGTTISASGEFTTAALDLLVERLRGFIPERAA